MSIMPHLHSQLGSEAILRLGGSMARGRQSAEVAIDEAYAVLLGAMALRARGGRQQALVRALDNHRYRALGRHRSRASEMHLRPRGERLLREVYGDSLVRMKTALARATGLDVAVAARLLATLAPRAMGAVDRERRRLGLDAQGLADLLETERARLASWGSQGLMALESPDSLATGRSRGLWKRAFGGLFRRGAEPKTTRREPKRTIGADPFR